MISERLIKAISALARSPMARHPLVVEVESALQECLTAPSNSMSNKSNGFDKRAYQREYMRRRRAGHTAIPEQA